MYRLCFELAGIVGVEPWRFTLRELAWMSDARGRHEWLQTGSQLAMLHNVNRGKNTAAKQPLDFSPYADRRPQRRLKAGIGILKTAFVDRNSQAVLTQLGDIGAYQPRRRKIPRPE